MRLLLLLVVVLAGCSSTAAPSPSPSPETPSVTTTLPPELLPGEDWRLVAATTAVDPAPFTVTLRFDSGSISGQAPVNRYNAGVEVSGDTIRVAGVTSTKMAGPEDAMAAEQAYFAALAEVRTWEVGDQMLTLSNDTGPLLVYAAPGSPAEFAMTLVGLTTKQAKAKIAEQGYEARVVSVDGDVRPVTMDYRPDRINLTIVDGVVTQATQG